MLKPIIPFSDFVKMDLKVGKVVKAEEITESDKLMRLKVDLGEEVGIRTIVAGIKGFYTTKALLNKLVVVVVNLEPKKMMGEESQGMMLACDCENKPIFLKPEKKVEPGITIR